MESKINKPQLPRLMIVRIEAEDYRLHMIVDDEAGADCLQLFCDRIVEVAKERAKEFALAKAALTGTELTPSAGAKNK